MNFLKIVVTFECLSHSILTKPNQFIFLLEYDVSELFQESPP